MANFILNIGLNVGLIEPLTQLDNTLYHLNNLFSNITTNIVEQNNGDWGKERVMVVSGQTFENFVPFKTQLIELCRLTMQDAIAFRYDEFSDIAYNREYQGEFYEFNEDYFLNP